MACLYLACKVDEFNVSIDEFVANLKSGTADANREVVLGLEAPLMRMLHYQLAVHGPWRPLEGHLLALRAAAPAPEALRSRAHDFLWRALLTDIGFLYAPSQVRTVLTLLLTSQVCQAFRWPYLPCFTRPGTWGTTCNRKCTLPKCLNVSSTNDFQVC